MACFRLGLAAAAALAALGATAAHAATKPEYGAPPAWVDVAPVPDRPTDASAALQTLLDDNQSQLSPSGDAFYTRHVLKVLKPEGLSDLTSETFTWDPDTESLQINTIAIIRGGRVIDLLNGGDKVLVLRRETGLEEGMLDGRLTATRQIEGLQVGDVLDVAWTTTKRDPVTHGRSEDPEGIGSAGVTERYRVRISWPTSDPVLWRVTDGLGQPTVTTQAGRTTLLLDKSDVKAPVAPLGAPARYYWIGRLYASSFKSWEDVSSLIYPLFDKAAMLEPSSPIRAEAAAIAARSTDPKVRAFEALKLVEDKVRYFYIGTNDGGYVPAAADETWRRRFGDCKGKTVVLLAVLRQLGVQAEPALVSTESGDGLDEDLPGLGRFNHVIIRATIDGKTYWLDGTRQGDVGGLKTEQPPAWRWALPLRPGGAKLERIVQPPLDEPMMDLAMKVDATKGVDTPAPVTIRLTVRGDAAVAMRLMAARATKDEISRAARQSFAGSMSWVEPKTVDWRDVPDDNAFELDMTGTADMDWRENDDLHVREFRFPAATSRAKLFPARDADARQDAPFAVAFPVYATGVIEVELPNAGKNFSVRGLNLSETVGGYAVDRSAKLDGDVARFAFSLKTLAPEAPASVADAANKELRRIQEEEDVIRLAPEQAAAKTVAVARSGA